LTGDSPTSLHVLNIQVVSPPPQVNYVATCSMAAREDESFIIFSTSFDLDLVGDMVDHLLWKLEPGFSIGSLDVSPFLSIVLTSDENLLEAIAFWRP